MAETTNVRKDGEMPEGPPGMEGSGGADIVALAADRLAQIKDAIDASGGSLTPDLRAEVGSVIAILETVCPDEDDDEEDMVPEPPAAAPMEMSEAEKALAKVMTRKQFMAYAVTQLAKAEAETDPVKKLARVAALQKALTYADNQFGATAFADPSSGVSIPMFQDPDQKLPEDVAVPGPEAERGQYAKDPSYSGQTSQQGTQAGTPQAMEKRLTDLRGKVANLGKGSSEVAKAWATSYVNDLPDSAFLYVEDGAKDTGGLTTPRSLRHFPFKDQDGVVDLPHLRDALARIPTSGIPDEKKKELTSNAQDILAHEEATQKSEVQKADRKDAGWPADLAEPDFRTGKTGRRSSKRPAFGYDNLVDKTKPARAR